MNLIKDQKSSERGNFQSSLENLSPCQVTKHKIKEFLLNSKKLANFRYEVPLLLGEIISIIGGANELPQ